MRFFSLVAVVAPLVSAIQFTTPAGGEAFSKGSPVTAKWSSVNTDPTTFSLYLWNFVNFPPYYERLASSIKTSAGSASIRIPCSVNASAGYQLTAINGTNVYVIYAQSGKFTVGGSSCTDPSTSSSTCAVTRTVTVAAGGVCTTSKNGTLSTTAKATITTTSSARATLTSKANGTITTGPSASVTTTSRPTTTPVTINSAVSASFAWITLSFGMALAMFML